ncbi:PAS domain-containing protein [Flavobacterium psychrophilum]|uniref:ATP-binding protein n=1 Tax=Flavobacterium psychrophilum TaxID=96345 RepID=UPI000B7C15D7|nr:ATP-binding protein [Flavobacterium psychrophilum]EKT3962877.1 PAS domain-containing protein [Flavobacterium psychrophilum]EKT4497821.1 PAS domain-containing protein [Flavobacterium psychrophilum]EKT4500835.1 PAS domain-containing protein [Flavobacterium psychrophilum]EKT4508504.1 PAS domain-containing protein [Flavobacterium psychrophilum]EKT4516452.1 PAS domain-containing protein [Flavobacterium psychrophilum]
MRIKTKLNLGVGLLFVLILILTFVSGFYMFSIKKDTENILKANYNTLEYSRNMLLLLDEINDSEIDKITVFETNLLKQVNNVTELGEAKATNDLKNKFDLLKYNFSAISIKNQIRVDIFEIMGLNMKAIKQKSDIAKHTAETANLWIAITGTLCFLIAFNLLVNLPNNIANPIQELTESIKEIANKNYSKRVHFMSHNEFGDLAKSFNTMAKKLEEYHNSNLYKLSFEKKRLETLINNMHDPIVGLDEQGFILFANNEALKIMGVKLDEVIGKLAANLALKNDLVKSLIMTELEDEKQKAVPMKIFADGKESYFEKEIVNIIIKPTGEENTIYIGDVIILRNITPFKELDFAKTNFIATISHELKTPISSIKFSLQLLEKEQTGILNEEQKYLVESIQDDSQRLLKITGELLELSQVETGNIQLNIEKSNPYDIVYYATEAVKIQAEQKQIELVVEADEKLPNIKADKEKTAWVLINFLTNAIKYSSENSKIIVKLKQENNHIIFQVIDTGKGIDNRYKSKVFDKYFQIPGSHKLGTGLGLAISKEFIEAQNGTISVESELGLGSTFAVKLKLFNI